MSSWDTVEGGGLIGADGPVTVTIESSIFGYDSSYKNGEQIIWILEGKTAEGEEVRQFYSIGSGWETADQGKAVVGREEFTDSNMYALFFQAALLLDGVAAVVQDRGYPDNATIWDGLTFDVERRAVDFKGEIGEKMVLLPIAFHGESGKAEAAPKSNSGSAGSSKVLRAKILGIAKKHDDHDAFLADVMDKHPEVEADDDLFASVLDESGLFAEAH